MLIPSSEENLINDLKINYENSLIKAPEDRVQWDKTHEILVKYLLNPTKEWEFEVWSVFTTTPKEKLKKIISSEN